MKDKDIINRLKSEAKVPDVLDKIKNNPNFFVPEPKKKKFIIPKTRYAFLSLIIILTLIISPRLTTVEATLTIDINPSVEMDINKNERVLKLSAINDDGIDLIRDIKYRGKTMSEVLDLLVEEAVNKNYIIEDDYILVGITSSDEEFSDKLTVKVNDKLFDKLEEKNKNAEVIIEKILNKDKKTENDAFNDIKITEPKRNLITELINISDYTDDDIKELAELRIKDLYDALKDEYIKVIIEETDYTIEDYKKLSRLKLDKLIDILNNQ